MFCVNAKCVAMSVHSDKSDKYVVHTSLASVQNELERDPQL